MSGRSVLRPMIILCYHGFMEERGLTSEEAKRRLDQFGPNELPKKKEFSEIRLLIDQIKSPLIYILIIAGFVAFLLGEIVDSVVIFLAVVVNTLLGFFQERKASKALAALSKVLMPTANVIRDGQVQRIPIEEIVPGDLVVLSPGERIAADGEVVEAVNLLVEEAILTGESMPVKKGDTGHGIRDTTEGQVFMGTTVMGGRGKMVVSRTGKETEMGKIATSLRTTKEERTPLQKRLEEFSKLLAVLIGVICLVILGMGLLEEYEFVQMFETAVAVAVAAIPEGLAVSLTVILALGMQRILKKKALVRKLVAAETLGSVSVICADKTGTLTEGKMRVVGIEVGQVGKVEKVEEEKLLLKGMILCNNMINPLEVAMREWVEKKVEKVGQVEQVEKEYPRVEEIPFSSEHKYIATRHVTGDKQHEKEIIFLSGAPEIVLSKGEISDKERSRWMKKIEEEAKKGRRIIAFATAKAPNEVKARKIFDSLKPGENSEVEGLKFLGVVFFEDPVRESVKKALEECQKAGIETKVITGDYKETAAAVLRQVGFKLDSKNFSMSGDELEKISADQLRENVEGIVLFYRVDPHQKLKIVEALKANGEVVAMMGDGVNDAPAIKKADIGIVVDSASDVARETADMVLLDSNFATIVAAVRGGRAIFETMKKVIVYLLSDSFTEVILVGGSLLLGLPLPLLPVQILWVNLVEDGLPAMALSFEPEEEEVMKDKPRPREAPILDKEMKILIFVIGLVTDGFLLGLFIWLLRAGWEMTLVRTVIFAGLGLDSLLYVFSCKTFRRNLWHEHVFNNSFLIASVLIGYIMLIGSLYLPVFQLLLRTQPLSFELWFLIGGLGIIKVGLIELVKWLFISRHMR